MRLHNNVLQEISENAESFRYLLVRQSLHDNSQADFSESQYEFMKLARVILHAADISNSVRSFDISYTFANKLTCEFTRQVQEETHRGLPVSEFMIISDEASKAKGEIFFLSKIARPYFESLGTIFPHTARLVVNINIKIKCWEAIAAVNAIDDWSI